MINTRIQEFNNGLWNKRENHWNANWRGYNNSLKRMEPLCLPPQKWNIILNICFIEYPLLYRCVFFLSFFLFIYTRLHFPFNRITFIFWIVKFVNCILYACITLRLKLFRRANRYVNSFHLMLHHVSCVTKQARRVTNNWWDNL